MPQRWQNHIRWLLETVNLNVYVDTALHVRGLRLCHIRIAIILNINALNRCKYDPHPPQSANKII